MITKLVDESQVDYGVVLGFDHIFDRETGLQSTKFPTQMHIPADWVFKACHENKNLLPCPGLHPYRKDALEKLEELQSLGATIIKWLPPAQGIDLADEKIKPFYKLLKQYEIPLLVHAGSEKTFKTIDKRFTDVDRFRLPLEMGVKIVAAHSGTDVIGSKQHCQVKKVVKLLEEFPNLWVDNSGIPNPGRFGGLYKTSSHPLMVERTLYGSDWPIPINSFYYLAKLGIKKVRSLEKIKNLIDRDIELKREFNYPDSSMTKAVDVLANLDRWIT
jgi:predicted TIM-barrel fold metal-dependent hydrolase